MPLGLGSFTGLISFGRRRVQGGSGGAGGAQGGALGGITNPAINQGGGGGGAKSFSISPSVSGKSTWNLDTDGALNLGTAGTYTITPDSDFTANVVMWGAGGGTTNYGAGTDGGAGGCSIGDVSLESTKTYQFIVGSGGAGGNAARAGGAGGAGTGIQITPSNTAVMVAGGGGGGLSGAPRNAGGGGGPSGESGGPTGGGGPGGTQSAAGVGISGGRRTGGSGSGRNGGAGSPGSANFAGGTGFGNGGTGAIFPGDCGGGGGGGGYYGGAGSGGDQCASGGGGGSGHINPTYVTGATYTSLFATSYPQSHPYMNGHPARGSSGNGGDGQGTPSHNGQSGRIYMTS